MYVNKLTIYTYIYSVYIFVCVHICIYSEFIHTVDLVNKTMVCGLGGCAYALFQLSLFKLTQYS